MGMGAAAATFAHYHLFCGVKTPLTPVSRPFVTPRRGVVLGRTHSLLLRGRRATNRRRPDTTSTTTVCFVVSPDKGGGASERDLVEVSREGKRMQRKKNERRTYLVAAVLSSLGFSSMAIAAVYYRFAWLTEGEVPISEIAGTFALAMGAAVGMEYWARWAHRALWHASLWHMHESHHKPREGPFELNDVFAIVNAVPAIGLLSYGFLNSGLVPGLCFGAGLGITLFGMAYMFVHDGLVHRRFPVGHVADVPYLRRVAAAHQIHHSDKFKGVPYGLFLGPKELLEEVGGREELDKEISRRSKASSGAVSTS